jgi:hypothetical protein
MSSSRSHFRYLLQSSVFALLTVVTISGCKAIYSLRRTPEGDLGKATDTVARLSPGKDVEIYNALVDALACKPQESCDSIGDVKCAEGKGRDAFTKTIVSLEKRLHPQDKGFMISIMAFPLPPSGRAYEIVRERLGESDGETSDGRHGWIKPAGVLIASDTSLQLDLRTSGDTYDLIEVREEPALPEPDEAIQRIYSAVDKRGGTHGARTSPEKLVALSVERGALNAEGCIGDLATDGREICLGRGVDNPEAKKLTYLHASSVVRRGGTLPINESAVLLGEVIHPSVATLVRTLAQRAGKTPLTIARDGNFAVILTQQRDSKWPWEFQHVIVMRRVALDPFREAELRGAWQSTS